LNSQLSQHLKASYNESENPLVHLSLKIKIANLDLIYRGIVEMMLHVLLKR
jgi:hypothetical protein